MLTVRCLHSVSILWFLWTWIQTPQSFWFDRFFSAPLSICSCGWSPGKQIYPFNPDWGLRSLSKTSTTTRRFLRRTCTSSTLRRNRYKVWQISWATLRSLNIFWCLPWQLLRVFKNDVFWQQDRVSWQWSPPTQIRAGRQTRPLTTKSSRCLQTLPTSSFTSTNREESPLKDAWIMRWTMWREMFFQVCRRAVWLPAMPSNYMCVTAHRWTERPSGEKHKVNISWLKTQIVTHYTHVTFPMFSGNGVQHASDLHLLPTIVVCTSIQKVHSKKKVMALTETPILWWYLPHVRGPTSRFRFHLPKKHKTLFLAAVS